MLSTDPDELLPEEIEEFHSLPRERDPGMLLEERTVRALHRQRLLRPPRGPMAALPVWLAAGLAAGIALFASGVAMGHWLGTRGTANVIAAVEQANARQVAAMVQQTGTAYSNALAALADMPDSAGNGWVTQGREAALTALYNVADEMVRLAPDDPVVARILQGFEQRPGETALAPARDSSLTKQVVWF